MITDAQYVFQYVDESELATMSTDPHRNNFEDQIRLETQKNTEVNQIENYLKLVLEKLFCCRYLAVTELFL